MISFNKLTSLLRDLFIISGVTAILFIFVNVLSYYYIKDIRLAAPDSFWNYLLWPGNDVGKKQYQEIFKDRADAAQRAYTMSPSFRPHPTLHYMTEPVRNEFFEIGLEGIRYEPGWDDEFVRKRLSENERLVFVFGGSTVLGHGLAGDETITHFMNQELGPKGLTVLNFGSQAYDQVREIDKLIYLLRSGYRPAKVVFLDGWNDIAGLGRNNMRKHDRMIWHGFSANSGEIAFTRNDFVNQVDHARLFALSLPVIRAYELLRGEWPTIDTVVPNRDPFVSGIDFKEAAFVFAYWAQYAERNEEALLAELVELYTSNVELVNRLAVAFGFDVDFFYQPMGLLDDSNPFVTDRARKAPGFAFVRNADTALRTAIADGKLKYHDLSSVLGSMPSGRYIDVAHYTPASNEVLSDEIVRIIGE